MKKAAKQIYDSWKSKGRSEDKLGKIIHLTESGLV